MACAFAALCNMHSSYAMEGTPGTTTLEERVKFLENELQKQAENHESALRQKEQQCTQDVSQVKMQKARLEQENENLRTQVGGKETEPKVVVKALKKQHEAELEVNKKLIKMEKKSAAGTPSLSVTTKKYQNLLAIHHPIKSDNLAKYLKIEVKPSNRRTGWLCLGAATGGAVGGLAGCGLFALFPRLNFHPQAPAIVVGGSAAAGVALGYTIASTMTTTTTFEENMAVQIKEIPASSPISNPTYTATIVKAVKAE